MHPVYVWCPLTIEPRYLAMHFFQMWVSAEEYQEDPEIIHKKAGFWNNLSFSARFSFDVFLSTFVTHVLNVFKFKSGPTLWYHLIDLTRNIRKVTCSKHKPCSITWVDMWNVFCGHNTTKNREQVTELLNNRRAHRYLRRLRVLCLFQVERAGVWLKRWPFPSPRFYMMVPWADRTWWR